TMAYSTRKKSFKMTEFTVLNPCKRIGEIMNFQISGLAVAQFTPLFGLSDQKLAEHGVIRRIVDKKPGYPCRVSLQDAELGESVLLLNYEHQSASTPYRASAAIFVREYAQEASLSINEIPEILRLRLLSIRAFDHIGMMVNADAVDGKNLESV